MRLPIRHATMDASERRVQSGALVEGFRVERVIATDPDLHTVVEADTPDGERVTVTLLSPAIAADRELRRSVLRRARLRSSIEHPHLAPQREPCEGRKGLYLVSASPERTRSPIGCATDPWRPPRPRGS
jgi:hypothetical protein